jgi:hypothetical protein
MKTAAQRHNDKLNKIFDPQIKRLQKYEAVAENVLSKLEQLTDIDHCGLDRCHVINAISRILQAQTDVK